MSEQNQERPATDPPAPESPPELWQEPAQRTTPEPRTATPELPAEELEDRWRRALADLDNLRKRHARDRPRELAEERAKVAAAWLPVIDNLELALSHADADPGSIVKGVEAVRDQAVEVLRGLGYPRHDETGVPFDPLRHDVVSVVDATDPDTEPNTVVQVLRPGYGEPGRQLRPAAVTVSRKPE
ncbi:nucleotide exchange factor GrpE [Streptomyces albipurpureus]|uniref:Protein GrpE n=1 Tax=Streptomyces albipurpureus TaxID=2897419 RepID=A0ABT0UR02_9ACTN|nr:nucleotide exchange factor GrpE [Streptomyces sp. CWNU-1]MCM2390530.1 nucleotide exchange factor GrpE [Streptomyces sp. CWNU-1]